MHWAVRSKKEPMLEAARDTNQENMGNGEEQKPSETSLPSGTSSWIFTVYTCCLLVFLGFTVMFLFHRRLLASQVSLGRRSSLWPFTEVQELWNISSVLVFCIESHRYRNGPIVYRVSPCLWHLFCMLKLVFRFVCLKCLFRIVCWLLNSFSHRKFAWGGIHFNVFNWYLI